MALLLTGAGGYAQFITVLLIFILVLALTACVTKWIARYQKRQNGNRNIEIIEAARLDNNKWIQIVRVGDSYKVLAICKDTVTSLGEVPKEALQEAEPAKEVLSFKEMLSCGETVSFKELFDRLGKKDAGNQEEPRDKDT